MNKRELVSYFEKAGFHPKHRLGQNFLIDQNLTRKLVEWATLNPDDQVVEIGPGMGMITREILATGARLTAVERDPDLRNFLEAEISNSYPEHFELVPGDAVDIPLGGVQDPDSCTVIANPPFSITGPWLAKVLDQGLPRCFSLLLQKEAVDRITASAGNKHFGTLAIRLEAAYEVCHTHLVHPRCFYPAPKVNSMIVVFRRRENPYRLRPELIKLIQQLFTQRRKQVGGRLKKLLSPVSMEKWEFILVKHGLTLQSRAEQIPTAVWIELDCVGE